ncbi:uncharacterized protein LOC111985766 [Quercus suber]|uniref:uncharacterized protein LOC111985766 n=1 Tax=Quercus suber TaxID=58331 RepID=UPI000CE20349|nr:uncharacterized protein LOC111985766 [Quercus suber]
METLPNRSTPLPRPFKFEEFWLSNISFPSVVSRAWNGGRDLVECINTFSRDASVWNKTHFRNVHHKKRRVIARIYGVQKALAAYPNNELNNLEKQLHQDLELLLDQERDLWALKSRINCMVQGDRNTSFYHVSTIARRNRNHIAVVMDDLGNWLTEEREVMEYFRSGFEKLYTTSHESGNRVSNLGYQCNAQLTDEVKSSLEERVSTKEIKSALWSMKPYKAPSPDGLHAGFFQRFWLTVGDSIKDEVLKAFSDRKIPDYLNKTHIVLIP